MDPQHLTFNNLPRPLDTPSQFSVKMYIVHTVLKAADKQKQIHRWSEEHACVFDKYLSAVVAHFHYEVDQSQQDPQCKP